MVMEKVSTLVSKDIGNYLTNRASWNIFYNAKSEGMKGDGTTDDYAKLSTLINTTIAGAEATIIFSPGTYKISTSITVPSNITLFLTKGAMLSPDSGKIITINGPIEADLWKIFTGSGTIAGSPKVEMFYPQWWGAKGDSTTDDTAAIQSALTAAGISGGIVFIPVGMYKITSTLTIPEGVTFEGVGSFTGPKYFTTGWNTTFSKGSMLSVQFGAGVVTNYTSPAVAINAGSMIKGVGFFYPSQVGVGTPTAYPPSILINENAKRWTIERCFFTAVYIAIDARQKNELGLIKDCVGYAMYRGIRIGSSTDVNRIENSHFNPNTYTGEVVANELAVWSSSNGVFIETTRTDWQKIDKCFCWGYNKGVMLLQNNAPAATEFSGSAFQMTISNCGFDATLTGIYADSTVDAWGIKILDCDFSPFNNFDAAQQGSAINYTNFSGSFRDITISRCRIWNAKGSAIRLNNVEGFTIADCYIEAFGSLATGSNVIQGISISNCRMGRIHDNYINGAFPNNSSTFRNGILLADNYSINIHDNDFRNVGGDGVQFFNVNNFRCKVKGNEFRNIGIAINTPTIDTIIADNNTYTLA